VKVTDRGYELRNPANDEYMSGFFKYETGGLTYTGYEVFIPNRNMLGENQKDLFKYFSANNAYSSKKLPFSERDADFVSLVGAKITDKDGNVVSDMFGFNHYDKTMKVLGSTGIDIANASNPLYIEVAGAFVPGVTSNITTTALTKANADAMKAVIEKAGGAVLYGEKETTFGKASSHSETGSGIGIISESGSGSEKGSNSGSSEVSGSKGIVFTDFSIKTPKPSLGGKVTIEFKVANDAEVGFFYASFTAQSDPSIKIIIKAQNEKNASSLPDHYDFSIGPNDIYKVSVPLVMEGKFSSDIYELDSFSAADEKISIDFERGYKASDTAGKVSNVGTESKYGESVANSDNANFFNLIDLDNKFIQPDFPILFPSGFKQVVESEPNGTLETADQIIYFGGKVENDDDLPTNKKVMGTLQPGGEDWWRIPIHQDGTLVLQTQIHGSAKLELSGQFGPKLSGPGETISKEVIGTGAMYQEVDKHNTFYLMLGDAGARNTEYEFLLDII